MLKAHSNDRFHQYACIHPRASGSADPAIIVPDSEDDDEPPSRNTFDHTDIGSLSKLRKQRKRSLLQKLHAEAVGGAPETAGWTAKAGGVAEADPAEERTKKTKSA